MSNVIPIERLRMQHEAQEQIEEQPIQQGVKKVSVDDGYTKIPNALLDAILEGDFTKNQIKLILGVIRKTTSWHKEMDWICNEQLAELCKLCDKFEASRVKQQLLTMRVLVKDGRKIGVNLIVSDWLIKGCENTQYCEKHTQKNVKTHNKNCRNSQPQKETITKEKINTPLTPQGEIGKSEENKISELEKNPYAEQAEIALDYYNKIAKTHCRDSSPFLKILEPQKSRQGWTLEEIKLVVRWVFSVWKTNPNSIPKPQNICRVTRFDGYVSDAKNWEDLQGDLNFDDVIDSFNRVFENRYEPVELNEITKQSILKLLPHLKNKTTMGFENYFLTYDEIAGDYFNKFGFSFVMKPETLQKVREKSLND